MDKQEEELNKLKDKKRSYEQMSFMLKNYLHKLKKIAKDKKINIDELINKSKK